MMKRGILAAFALVLFCALLLSVPKADAATQGACDENVTWTLDDTGTLTISGSGLLAAPMFDSWWGEFADPAWESNRQAVKKVVINEGITAIGDNAFRAFYNLETIEIPAGVTELYWDIARDSGVKTIIFKGACPELKVSEHHDNCGDWQCDGGSCGSLCGVSATVYYPAGDCSYASAMDMEFCSAITWQPNTDYLTGTAPGEYATFEIPVARMILGNALEFQFGVEKTAQTSWIGAYAVISKSWADGTITQKVIPFEQWGTADAYYAIVYDGLAAKEMGDTFYVTIYNADGVAISEPKTDSVRDYVARAFGSQPDTGKTMMVDMLGYGAAAQLQFGYNTTDLANNCLTEAQKAYATQGKPAMANYQYKGPHYLGTRFVLESRIQVQVAFDGLQRDMYAVYNYTDSNGKTKSVRVEGKDFITAGDKKGIELSQLVYADARGQVTVMVYNADGTLHGMAIDSIESCAYRSSGDVFAALMQFADAAKKHLYG